MGNYNYMGTYTCGHTASSSEGTDSPVSVSPAQEFVILDEMKDINYDEMIKQIVNVTMVVGIVYAVLRAAKAMGLDDGILRQPMSNVLRTSMLAGVVAPILIQQTRNMIVEGTEASAKVLRNVAVAAALTYVLLFMSAKDLAGKAILAPVQTSAVGLAAAPMTPVRRSI